MITASVQSLIHCKKEVEPEASASGAISIGKNKNMIELTSAEILMSQKKEIQMHRDTVFEVRRKLRTHAKNLDMHWHGAEMAQISAEMEEIDRDLTRLGDRLEEIERDMLHAWEQIEMGEIEQNG